MRDNETAGDLIVLMPVYNDWQSARMLVWKLDTILTDQPFKPRLLLLDDCSSTSAPADLVTDKLKNLVCVESLRLRCNLGHQRAIAVGLSFIYAERPCDAVLIMDADGEDKPEDVPHLIEKFLEERGGKVIFAERVRRSEDWLFRIGYIVYRGLHRMLTGIRVRVGNFSIIPAAYLERLVVVSETWNHYAATVIKSRIPHQMLPIDRGQRLAGRSSMNYAALMLHGLSSISVFADIVGVRLTLTILATTVILIMLLFTVLVIRWGTHLSIPGWATTATGLLLVMVLQMLTVALGLTLLVLFNRSNLNFLPLRDFRFFIGGVQKAYERTG